MNPARATIFSAFAACVALSGCDGGLANGEMEEPSLVLTQPLGQTIPGAPQVPVSVPQGIVTFTFTVPSIPLSGGSKTSQEGGFTTKELQSRGFTRSQAIHRVALEVGVVKDF